MIQRTQVEAPEGGKSAPESTHMGTSRRFMMAWNPWIESSRQAKTNPRLFRAKEIRKKTASKRINCQKLKGILTAGASKRRTAACNNAIVVPPSTLPKTRLSREMGATRTESRNPSARSSMTEMLEKIEEKRRTIITVPGKKYSK